MKCAECGKTIEDADAGCPWQHCHDSLSQWRAGRPRRRADWERNEALGLNRMQIEVPWDSDLARHLRSVGNA